MAKLTHHKVIKHRGGMRPGNPDPEHIRPMTAPSDKGGPPETQSGSHTPVAHGDKH